MQLTKPVKEQIGFGGGKAQDLQQTVTPEVEQLTRPVITDAWKSFANYAYQQNIKH